MMSENPSQNETLEKKAEEETSAPIEQSPLEKELTKLKSRDFRKKNEAIKKMGKMKDRKAYEKLLEIIKSSGYSDRIRLAAIDSLSRKHREEDFQKLLQDLSNDKKQSREIRRTSITLLSRFKDPKFVRTFINALEDEYRFIRIWAVRGLLKIHDSKAYVGLIQALGDSDEDIRKDVRDHLERLDDEIVPFLIKAFNNSESNKFLRYASLGLIGRKITHPKALPAMINALSDGNDRIITIAIRGLGKTDNPDAIPPLVKLYKENERKRRLIEDALFRIGQDNQKVLIYYLATLISEKDEALPELAISMFKKFANSYTILGDIAEDSELNEDFRDKVKEIMKKL